MHISCHVPGERFTLCLSPPHPTALLYIALMSHILAHKSLLHILQQTSISRATKARYFNIFINCRKITWLRFCWSKWLLQDKNWLDRYYYMVVDYSWTSNLIHSRNIYKGLNQLAPSYLTEPLKVYQEPWTHFKMYSDRAYWYRVWML